jgi:GNAT superfamily N-acetyltransferase
MQDLVANVRGGFALRAAEPRDLPSIVTLIAALAEYEKLAYLLEVTPDKLMPHLFGTRPAAEALVVEDESSGELIGFALFFTNFSTFLGKPGLYLEDLFVLPAQRRRGVGRALFEALGKLAVERDYGRFEWSVLDWNEPALRFYAALGATVLPDWRICRISGATLERFGSQG